MDQPCYKCSQVVEQGRAFCPHCGAPQIRVLVAEGVPAATRSPATEGLSDESVLPASQTVPVLALPVEWSRALKPCFLAALVGSVLMVMGLHPFVAMPCAGFLSVVFYRQRQQNLAIKLPAAIRVGAFGGLLNAGFMVLITALAATIPDLRTQMHEKLLEVAQKSAAANADNPLLQKLLQELKTPDGFVFVLFASCVVALVLSLVLGSAGGAVGGAIFGRRRR